MIFKGNLIWWKVALIFMQSRWKNNNCIGYICQRSEINALRVKILVSLFLLGQHNWD